MYCDKMRKLNPWVALLTIFGTRVAIRSLEALPSCCTGPCPVLDRKVRLLLATTVPAYREEHFVLSRARVPYSAFLSLVSAKRPTWRLESPKQKMDVWMRARHLSLEVYAFSDSL